MARYVTGYDRALWNTMCVEIAHKVLSTTGRPLILIPHVTIPGDNDHELLSSIYQQLGENKNIYLLPSTLSAAELKYVISKCDAVIASRTHAAIAAFSTGVPALCLSYSTKTEGLCVDMFNSLDYCINAKSITSAVIIERLNNVLNNSKYIREVLHNKTSEMKSMAYDSGNILSTILYGSHVIPKPSLR